MNSAWVMAIGAGCANAVVALASKAAERSHCRLAPYGVIALGVAGLTAWAPAMKGRGDWGDWRLWAFGGAMGALYLAAIASMLRANRRWPPSVVWSVANMAFVLPILLSAFGLGEPLRWMDSVIAAGFLLMLAMLTREAPGGRAAGIERTLRAVLERWLLLGAVFAINGLLMFGFKVFGVWLPAQPSPCLVMVMYGSGAALAIVLLVVRGVFRFTLAETGWGLATGVAIGLSALALLPAMRLPAAAAFPVIQGLSLAGGALACAFVFRESLTMRKGVGIAIGLVALALTALR
jgi:multidrug transporter EmrE-like cation transporter